MSLFLGRKTSMESFVSPSAHVVEFASDSGGLRRRVESTSSSGGLRRLKSLSTLQARKEPLPQIHELCVTQSTCVRVRQQRLTRWIWPRQCLRLTKHTLTLHQNEDPNSPTLDMIILRKVSCVERVKLKAQAYCLRIQTTEAKDLYLAFDTEEALYTWLDDIHIAVSPISKPKDFEHKIHVVLDKDDKTCLIGMPDDWSVAPPFSLRNSITSEMLLPEMTFADSREPIIDASLLLSRTASPDTDFISDDESEPVIMTARIAVKPITQRLLDLRSEKQSLKITIQDASASAATSATLPPTSEASPSTPMLTPDTSPMSPFRESPYRYRESDAQNLSGQIHKQSSWPDAHGGYADIWRAQWHTETTVFPVAVKVLRVLSQDQSIQNKIQKRLRKEVRVWHQLRHSHVVQLLGICDGFGPFVSMVSPWYENGNVNTYLKKLGDAGTPERRLKLLTEVAAGLSYLHHFSFPVVHGDVKGANILVNDRGEAALADFGLSSILQVAGDSTTSTFSGGSVRWMAPELIDMNLSPHNVTPKTCASDTYSYGSVILEILTGERPYKHISNDMQVINQLLQGYKPKRPLKPAVNPGVWELMERCWNTEVGERPDMALVLSRMEKFYAERRRSMLQEDMLGVAL